MLFKRIDRVQHFIDFYFIYLLNYVYDLNISGRLFNVLFIYDVPVCAFMDAMYSILV